MKRNQSILLSIKKRLGIGEDYEHFDDDVIMDINSAFTFLNQLGIGPKYGFSITGEDEEWLDFTKDIGKLEFIKTYVYLKVKLMFDPPQNSFTIDAINNQIKELEWRILVQNDLIKDGEEENQNG